MENSIKKNSLQEYDEFENHDHQGGLGIEYPTEPDAKKLYAVGCHTAEDWDHIHEALLQDGTLEDNIPKDHIDCADLKSHSATRAVYLLTDEEAQELLNHPKIKYVHENFESYPCKYKPNPRDLHAGAIRNYRYADPGTKQYRNWSDFNQLPSSPGDSELNRSGFQLLRHVNKADPWYTGVSAGSSQTFTNRIQYYADGTDVDVIVGDDGCWFGHSEFQSNATGYGPTNLVGGNPLRVGFKGAGGSGPTAQNATNGTCELLDLVLDAPYWLDPAWFEADAATRLTLRWDGTTVPVDSVARTWWSTANQRSASFASLGTVSITSAYTRTRCNGSHSARPTISTNHGTQCTANAVGRNQGWAFNANKWSINAYGTDGADFEPYFDIMKLFHQAKGNNPTYGNKNPTISSNSWGYRTTSHRTTAYYFYRQGTSGGTGLSYTSATLPGFMNYVGTTGDGGPYAGKMKSEHLPNSALEAGAEMIAAGVIFVGAAGNSNQKQVSSSHPDYNNYWSTAINGTLTGSTHLEFNVTAYNTTNRRGYPQQLGKYTDGTTGQIVYPVINIGALDDSYAANGKERKVDYSDMGNEIDCYAAADGTLSATNATSGYARPDTYAIGAPASITTDSGITGITYTTSELTGSGITSFRHLQNKAFRITTSSSTTGTASTIAFNLLGAASLTASTTPTSGGNDDGYWDLTLPFNIEYAGITTNKVYPGTNTYITFTGGSSAYQSLSYSNPALPKIMISCADNSCQRLYYGTEGSSPDRTYRIRFEGHNSSSGGVLGSPTMVYEAVFYENAPSQIDIHVGANARVTTTIVSVLTSYDSKFSGTSSACPVACGLIACKLQHNRTWTWQNVRTWLQDSVGAANTAQFDTGVESTTANDANWANMNSLEGGSPIVIWDALTGNEPDDTPAGVPITTTISGPITIVGVTITTT